jgi:Zn-dependent protease
VSTDPAPRTDGALPGSSGDQESGRRPERGLVLGRPWGIPIVLAPSWFIIAAVITVLFAPVVQRQLPDAGPWAYLVSGLFAVLLYGSVLIHELGHVVMARRFGIPVRRITLQLLGGVSELEDEASTPGRQFAIALAGPVLSLALAALGAVVLLLTPVEGVIELLLLQVTAANALVGVFNLLPGLPLDGGHLVRAGVWSATGRPSTGTRAAGWSGRVVAVLAFALPFLLAFAQGRPAPALTSVIWAALISAFIWTGATAALRAADREERLPRVRAATLVRRAAPVPARTPLALALERMRAEGAAAIVVVDVADRPLALVSEAAVAAVPLERRPWVTVDTVSRRITPATTIDYSAVGDDLIAAVVRARAPELLVVDAEGLVVGVLAVQDVESVLAGER